MSDGFLLAPCVGATTAAFTSLFLYHVGWAAEQGSPWIVIVSCGMFLFAWVVAVGALFLQSLGPEQSGWSFVFDTWNELALFLFIAVILVILYLDNLRAT